MSKKQEEIRQLDLTAHEYAYMAKGYYESGLFDQALEQAENALYLYRLKADPSQSEEVLFCLRIRACVISKYGEKKEWKKAFKNAEKMAKKQGDEIVYAGCLTDKGTAYGYLGKTKKAVRLRKKAIKLLTGKEGAEKELAHAQYLLGATYYGKKENDKADRCFSEAYRLIGDEDRVLFALGSVKVRKGEYEKAIDYLSACLRLREEKYREIPFHAELGEIYLLIGDVYSLMKVYVKAVKFYARALRTYEIEGGDEVGYVETCKRLYGTYLQLGEEARAEEYLKRVEE